MSRTKEGLISLAAEFPIRGAVRGPTPRLLVILHTLTTIARGLYLVLRKAHVPPIQEMAADPVSDESVTGDHTSMEALRG